jgi:hypothetical protein
MAAVLVARVAMATIDRRESFYEPVVLVAPERVAPKLFAPR